MQRPNSTRQAPSKTIPPLVRPAAPSPDDRRWPPTGIDLMYAYFFPDED